MIRLGRRQTSLQIPLFAFLTSLVCAGAFASETNETQWTVWRTALFGDRPIHRGNGVIELDAPLKAEDPALVPVKIISGLNKPRNAISRLSLYW